MGLKRDTYIFLLAYFKNNCYFGSKDERVSKLYCLG